MEPELKTIIETVDIHLDTLCHNDYVEQPLAQDWARVSKIGEELGEAIEALILYTGQNPRKGKSGNVGLLLAELADVHCTAILAIQHFTKNIDTTTMIVVESYEKIGRRVMGEYGKVKEG